MPGPYAHITLLYELMQPRRLELLFTAESGFRAALETCFPYCVLGAVSPDYPNLICGNDNASQWAEAMHCVNACEMIVSGVKRVRGAKGTTRYKQLAWLLGYCAHVATDVTIHPVVQAKVGVYAENQRQHRICEMNQDSYIYRRMNLGEIGESDRFAMTVVRCGNPDDITRLDKYIITLWQGMLADVHAEMCIMNPPDINSWHREFNTAVAGCSSRPFRLFPLANAISTKMGLAYPTYFEADRQFIEDQALPLESPIYLHYDEIFDHAVCNVSDMWRKVEQMLMAEDPVCGSAFGDWNLDNGRDEHGRLVFW